MAEYYQRQNLQVIDDVTKVFSCVWARLVTQLFELIRHYQFCLCCAKNLNKEKM